MLAAVAACEQAIPGLEGLPLPGAAEVHLHPDGRVAVTAPAPPGDDGTRVRGAATLLRELLAMDEQDAATRAPVPGALVMLLARALGTIDLPPPSFEQFCEALRRFASPTGGHTPLHVHRRTATPSTAPYTRHASPYTRPSSGASPAPPSPGAAPVERSVAVDPPLVSATGGAMLHLQDELRLREAHRTVPTEWLPARRRGVPLAVALGIWVLAALAGIVLMHSARSIFDISRTSTAPALEHPTRATAVLERLLPHVTLTSPARQQRAAPPATE